MLLTEEQLRQVIAGRPIGDEWPHHGGSEDDIEEHLRRAVAALQATGVLDVDADFGHYGSGYASYVHAFCEKAGGRSRARQGEEEVIQGIAVYLSRLTPFAAYGAEERTKFPRGASGGFIDSSTVYSTPPGDWTAEVTAIRAALSALGFAFPAREQLTELLPFKAKIPTILDDKHVFDAIFYWED